MFNRTKNIMKVSCHIGEKHLVDFEWDEMPNVGMGFDYKKREYMIIAIEDSKISLKDITNKRRKQI